MATHDYVIANGTGAAVRSDLNGALAAIVSNNSSATQPATMYAYQWWADTTAGLLKIRNSANSAWVTLFQLDGEWSTLPIENGTAAAPSIYFKDSGTDTGFYSPGADQIGISTGGTSRIVVDASGNVNIDSNTFYVDAANNRVGFGTTGPGRNLTVQNSSTIVAASLVANPASIAYLLFGDTDSDAQGRVQYDNSNDSLQLYTNGNERATIDSSGRLLVGIIASPAHQLQVSTDSAGKPSTSTWTIVSDERIKEDIELADLDLCYEAIKAIPLKRYKWRDEIYTAEQVTDRRKLGWIAQDVETVFPKAVGTHEFKYNQVFEEDKLISEDVIEDCRNLNADQLYAAMYGAVQKLMAKVETLEASNADLLARVAALEAA